MTNGARTPPLPPVVDPSPQNTLDKDPGDDNDCLKHAKLFSGVHTSHKDPGDSASLDAASESPRWTGVVTSFGLLSELMLRINLVEVEMAKAREALRLEAERRCVELEGEMTWMLCLLKNLAIERETCR
ncbi:hypothetical protein NL676_032096 [Syzygium grande]|nr:hypothetical protein NL676_032096 [Syzygium grande]